MHENDLSYCELRTKEVVNAVDGKRMGRIVDILFSSETGKISGIVVPIKKQSVFGKAQDLFVPWRCVEKIGEDVILVCLVSDPSGKITCADPPPPPPGGHKDGRGERCDDRRAECPTPESGAPPLPNCDYRCEKCMLFDCAYRWSHMN